VWQLVGWVVRTQVTKEPEVWGDAKFTRKSPFMGICVRPGWTARASQLSKGWVPLCADFMGKAG